MDKPRDRAGRIKRQNINDLMAALDLSATYTIPDLMALWGCSRTCVRFRIAAAVKAGYNLQIDYAHPRGGRKFRQDDEEPPETGSNIGRREHKYVDELDLGDPDQPECPHCRENPLMRSKNGRVPHLHHHLRDEKDPDDYEATYCLACGYDPQAERMAVIQFRAAKAYRGQLLQAA